MGMRDRDRTDAAARVHFSNGFVVRQRDTIPKQIPARRLKQKRALSDCKFRLRPDSEKLRRFIVEFVAVRAPQFVWRCPLLPAMANILAFVFASRAMRRRLDRLLKLRSAFHADKISHVSR